MATFGSRLAEQKGVGPGFDAVRITLALSVLFIHAGLMRPATPEALIAPVVPFLGAFIATCKWDYKKSMLYLVLGGLAKYGALLVLIGLLNYQFDPDTAQFYSILAIIIIIGLSFVSSYIYRKKIEKEEIK